MVGGRLHCLSCFFTSGAMLLLGVCLPDVESYSCQGVVNKAVGDTVELSSCLSSEGVTYASWRHGETRIAEKSDNVTKDFNDRFSLNPINFSLTARNLTRQDSGDYSFLSAVTEQRKTVFVTLQVHESITEEPGLTFNSTWDPSNKSCAVLLECSSTSHSQVNYSWSARDRTQNGPRLQVSIRPEDGAATFTCTVSAYFSAKSASKTVKCSNDTGRDLPNNDKDHFLLILIVAVGGSLIIVFAVGLAVCVYHCRRKPAGEELNDITVYADVADVAVDGGRPTMKPCSVYETIDNRIQPVRPVTPGPQTVYDKIQFSHMRNVSSPYQEV